MNFSSLHGNSASLDEARAVATVVNAHVEQLRERALGRKFRLDGMRFALLKADRNVLYRLGHTGAWFLKIPSRRESDATRREAHGFRCISASLADMAGYRMPSAVLWSEEHNYLLSAEVAGQPLNRFFYRAAIWLKRRPLQQVRTTFERVGDSLARFHRARLLADTPATNRPLDQVMRKWPARGCAPDRVAEEALETVRRQPPFAPDAVIHGNMQLENVIAADAGVTFIDFENCGRGSRYEDLSILCSQLLLTDSLLWFPPRVSEQAVRALLGGYGVSSELRMDALQASVGARLIEYYLGFIAAKGARIAGVPVKASKLKRLLADVATSRLRLPQ
jgi:Ser/Thr protein kinase RdoA (MazF antagonist)